MAQYFTDFTDSGVYTVGQFPPGFTARYSGTTASSSIVSLTTPSGSQALRMTDVGASTYAGLSLNAVDSDPARIDVEIVARYSVQDAVKNNSLNLFARGAGTQRSDAYFCHSYASIVSGSDTNSIRDRINGTNTTIATATVSRDAGIWYWVRVRVNGDQLKAKFWTDGTAEPATWTLEGVTTRLTDGWVGMVTGAFTTTQNGVVDIDLFGVGTGGDSAPVSSTADTTAPTLTSPTGTPTGATTASGTVTTDEWGGTLYWLASSNATETGAAVKAGSSQAVSETGSQAVTVSGLTASTAYYLHYLHRDAAGNDSAVATSAQFTTGAAGDTTAPTLSAAGTSAVTETTATGAVTTDEGNGTLYWLVNTSATTPSVSAVQAGQSQAVSASGAQSVSITGLTGGTSYYVHFQHKDAAGNDSAVITSAQFTTSVPAVVKGASVTLHLGSTPQASLSGITARWWDSPTDAGAPLLKTDTASTDAAGTLEINIDAVTALAVGGVGYLSLYKAGADAESDLHFASRITVSDIG